MPDNGRHQTSDHFLLHLKDAQESTGMQRSKREEGVKHFRWLTFPLQSQRGMDSRRINKKYENSQRPAWWKQRPGRNFGPSTCWQNDSVPQSPHFAENLKKERRQWGSDTAIHLPLCSRVYLWSKPLSGTHLFTMQSVLWCTSIILLVWRVFQTSNMTGTL